MKKVGQSSDLNKIFIYEISATNLKGEGKRRVLVLSQLNVINNGNFRTPIVELTM